MSGPGLADFAGRVGQDFTIRYGENELALRLDAAEALPGSPREAGGFRLEFSGPPDVVLAQGIFPFEHEGALFELFAVPISRDAQGARYDVTFF